MLSGKHIVLGVTGGIAAYKACELVSGLCKIGAAVDVIVTENAAKLVSPLALETLSRRPVTLDTFAHQNPNEITHIALAQKADLFVIAPATANVMAKLAHGIADDMLTTTALACTAPVLLAPGMNTAMWNAPATRENLRALTARGVHIVGPESGSLACGDEGLGRMSEPDEIVEAIIALLNTPQDMRGLRVLVTAGPTVERIDPVRFLSNDSSGKMGYALAEAAAARGADVTLVSGPVYLPPPVGVTFVKITSTRDLHKEMLSRCKNQHIIVQAAAPSDYRARAENADAPKINQQINQKVTQQKIKKYGGAPLTLTLIENPDVAEDVGKRKLPGQVLVGFAAETQDLLANALKKLAKKNLDLIVANDVTLEGAGFGADTNIASLVEKERVEELPKMSKRELAERIWNRALELKKPALKKTARPR